MPAMGEMTIGDASCTVPTWSLVSAWVIVLSGIADSTLLRHRHVLLASR
jgi:hypothetical protein